MRQVTVLVKRLSGEVWELLGGRRAGGYYNGRRQAEGRRPQIGLLTFAGETPSQVPWGIAPYDSEAALEGSSRGISLLRSVAKSCLTVHGVCASFLWIYVQFFNVFLSLVLQCLCCNFT